jgi:hypothetical protein
MTERTNCAAWGLVAVLSVLVLSGSGLLFASYQNGLPPEERWLTLLPRSEWGFGSDQTIEQWHGFGPSGWGSGRSVIAERHRLGFFIVRIK